MCGMITSQILTMEWPVGRHAINEVIVAQSADQACHKLVSVSCSLTGPPYLAGVHYTFCEQGIPANEMTLVARQNALHACMSLQSASDSSRHF